MREKRRKTGSTRTTGEGNGNNKFARFPLGIFSTLSRQSCSIYAALFILNFYRFVVFLFILFPHSWKTRFSFLFFFFFSFRYSFFSFFSFLHWKLNYFDNFLTLFFHPRPRVCFFSLLLAFSLSFSFFFSISLSLSVRVWLLTCLARASFNWILLTRLSKRAEYTFSSPLFAIWADSFDRAVLSMPSTSSSCCFLSCWLLLLPLGDKESNQKTFQIKCIDSAHTHTHTPISIYLSSIYLYWCVCVCVCVEKRRMGCQRCYFRSPASD